MFYLNVVKTDSVDVDDTRSYSLNRALSSTRWHYQSQIYVVVFQHLTKKFKEKGTSF